MLTLRCQFRKQGVFSMKGCNTSFALSSKMRLNISLPLKLRFVLKATDLNFNPLLFYFERSHLLNRRQIILISNQTTIWMRLMNSVFIRLHIAARAWTPFAKRGTKLMKRKIWKPLRGRYGDVCIGRQLFCVCVCAQRPDLFRDVKLTFHCNFSKSFLFSFFSLFSLRCTSSPRQALNQPEPPVVSNVINTEQKGWI